MTSVRSIALVAGLAVLIAGCSGTSPAAHGSESTAPGSSPPTMPAAADALTHTYKGCAESNFIVPIPTALFELPPRMKPVTMDPAGQVAGVIVTLLACDSARINGTDHAKFAGIFEMLPVQPIPGAAVANATAYVWLGYMGSNVTDLVNAWAGRKVSAFPATVDVSFSGTPLTPNSMSEFSVQSPGLGESTGSTVTAGLPSRGAGGTMAAYTLGFDDSGPLRAHEIQFSEYRSYANGAAHVDPGVLPILGLATPSRAWHSFGFDVEFHLDRFVDKE